MADLRCKMVVRGVTEYKDHEQKKTSESLRLEAVTGPVGTENAEWAKATPSASLTMTIDNPNAWGKVAQGDEVWVDLTVIPKPPAETPAA